jgi:hypothetical protein
VMSLSPWEEQILDSIKDRITRSDPGLAALLDTFTTLVVEEDMPPRENIPGTVSSEPQTAATQAAHIAPDPRPRSRASRPSEAWAAVVASHLDRVDHYGAGPQPWRQQHRMHAIVDGCLHQPSARPKPAAQGGFQLRVEQLRKSARPGWRTPC